VLKVSKRWPSIFKTARRAGLWTLLMVPLLIAAGCETRRCAEAPDPEARTASLEMGTRVPASDAAIRAMIGQAQFRLARLGYKPGHYDGVIGPQTRTAIRHYQVDRGLPQNSSVTGELLNDLNTSIEDRRGHPVTWLPGTLPGPDYQPGDAFIYSNGRVERVVSVENGVVSWRTDQGESFEASENFILPWQNWGSKAERGQRWIHAAPDTLWPLMLGREQSFAANGVVQYGSRPENRHVARET